MTAQDKANEEARLRLNATRLQTFLDETATPCLLETSAALTDAGIANRVEVMQVPGQIHGFSLGLKLIHREALGLPHARLAWLSYTGNPDTLSIAMEMRGAGALNTLAAGELLTIEECTVQRVQDDAAAFVLAILKP